jgi:hypothetical protein
MYPLSKYAAFTVFSGSLACMTYTIFSTSITWIEADDWGLTSLLPPVFYVGLFLLGCLWYVGFKSRSYLPVSLVLTVAYLYFVPTIVRVPVWISNSYYPFGESLIINSTGHLVENPNAIFVSYHSWPLFLYFSSAVTIITGVPHEILLKFFPIFTVSMYGIFTFLILRIKLAVQYALAGAAIMLGGLFIRQQYFGPQSISYIFFLCTLLLLSLLFFSERANQRLFTALLMSLIVVTTFTHPLTSFMSTIAILAVYLVDRFVTKKRSAKLGRLFLLAVIVWFVYNIAAAPSFFNTSISRFFEIFTGLRSLGIYSESSRIVASVAQRINFAASWAIVGLCGIVAAISILQILWHTKKKRPGMAFAVFNVILLILLGMFAFFGEYGEVEAYQRAFMFGLVPISFLCVHFLRKKHLLLVAFIAALLFINIPAQYGSDNFRLATNTHLSGVKFLTDYSADQVKLAGRFSIYIRYFDPFKNYTVVDGNLSAPFVRFPNSTVVEQAVREAEYVVLSDLEHNYYIFYLGADPLEQVDFGGFDRVYDNGDFCLLKRVNASGR